MRHARARRLVAAVGIITASIAATVSTARADFPERNIRLIVSFPAGGTGDAVGRALAEALSARLKTTVVVDNQGGAAGSIGTAAVARAAPDGYTMLLSALAVFAIIPHMRKVDFDPIKDLKPIARVGESLRAIAINPKLPAKTLEEFVAYAKKHPKKLNYGSAGAGSTVHVLTESFQRAAGIEMVHIPYRGAAPALQGLLEGSIDVLIDTVVIPQIKNGTVRGLAAVGEERLADLPDLPTLAEAGFPNVRTSGWTALFGPARLPPPLVALYAKNVEAAFKDKAFVNRLVLTGSKPAFLGPDAFAQYLRDDNAYFGRLIADAGIKLN
jgi:tripartite-type tricarboxylate transporter receptor subunit TctC